MKTQRSQTRFGLPSAIGVSVCLRLLFLLVSLWLPVGQKTAAPVESQEDVLQFTFAPAVDDEDEQNVEGTIPDFAPTTAPEPRPEEQLSPDFQAAGPPTLDAPSSAGAPEDQALLEVAEAPSEVEPLAPELREEPAPESYEELAERRSPPLPAAADAPFRNPVEEPPTSTESTLDVDRALDDFARAVDRARAANPPKPSGGGRASNVFRPDLAALPGTGFGVGNLLFESRDFDWSDYSRQLYVAIWRAWHSRLYQSTDDFEKWAHLSGSWILGHQTQVRFVIESNGQVSGIELEMESGSWPLDNSALDALAEVILPPLPDDFPREQEVVHARFIATGEVRALRPSLGRLKRLGYF